MTYTEKVPYFIEVHTWDGTGMPQTTPYKNLDELFDKFLTKMGEDSFKVAGWHVEQDVDYRTLMTDLLQKNEVKVHYIAVGEHNYSNNQLSVKNHACFFADDRNALEVLCDEWGLDKSKIEEDKTITEAEIKLKFE